MINIVTDLAELSFMIRFKVGSIKATVLPDLVCEPPIRSRPIMMIGAVLFQISQTNQQTKLISNVLKEALKIFRLSLLECKSRVVSCLSLLNKRKIMI